MKEKWPMELRAKIKAEIEEVMGTGEFFVRNADEVEDRFGMRQRMASEDAIRNFCNGIGNVNPLYRSMDYARNSIHGSLIAPPHFLHAIAFQGIAQKRQLEYITGNLYGGNRAQWFKTIQEGDIFTVVSVPGEVKDITREGTALQFLATLKTIYKNQKSEVVAVFTSSSIMFADPGGEEKESKKRFRKPPEPHRWTEEEVNAWYELIEKEEIRGKNPLYWEDISIGDQLAPTHHFYTPVQAIAFFSGCAWFEDWRFRMLEARNNSSIGFEMSPDPATGILELPDPFWHIFDSIAQREGMGRAFCPGRQMECWLTTLITNWMGDAGFLKMLDCKFRALLFNGAKVICRGEVVHKYVEGDEHLVDLKVTLEDHEGVLPVPDGSATVMLPSRSNLDNQLGRY